jgi:hypothetical protein
MSFVSTFDSSILIESKRVLKELYLLSLCIRIKQREIVAFFLLGSVDNWVAIRKFHLGIGCFC